MYGIFVFGSMTICAFAVYCVQERRVSMFRKQKPEKDCSSVNSSEDVEVVMTEAYCSLNGSTQEEVLQDIGRQIEGSEQNISDIVGDVAATRDDALPLTFSPDNTIIAGNVKFDGNITAVGHLYIYGQITGDIRVTDGVVSIMQSGIVKGSITSKQLIIDGKVTGKCRAGDIDILTHGCVSGPLIYGNLSVKKGAKLTGKLVVVSQ